MEMKANDMAVRRTVVRFFISQGFKGLPLGSRTKYKKIAGRASNVLDLF